jgi:GNAT superfamily N-acetyltransferase
MDPRIRVACARDIEPMCRLLGELFRIETDFRIDPARQRNGLRLLLEGGSAIVLVAQAGADLVGMCSVQVLVSTAEGGAVGLLEDLVVSAPWRGQGIGSALLGAAEACARSRGLSRLQLLADRGNQAALGFYDCAGWQRSSMIMLRRTLAG